MGNPTVANSATRAKPDLLAYGAHITAVMFATSRDDLLNYSDDLCEVFGRPAPVPEPAPVPRPQRKRTASLSKALREAKKAGIPVTGATFTADSVSLSFGEAAKSNGNDLDQWLAGRHENPAKRN
jgi:hypothetical protein